MTDEELDFLKGIIKQLQDFVEEKEKFYYLVITFEGDRYDVAEYYQYCWCVSDNKNGGCMTKHFRTKDEAVEYGENIKKNYYLKIHSYSVVSEKDICSGDFIVHWGDGY